MAQVSQISGLRVALVHDFLLDLRGGERVFLQLCAMFPEADIFTAVYDRAGTQGRFDGRNVVTSGLQRLRPTSRTFRALLPFYPAAIESLDLRGYDLVISSSSAWAHGVIPDEHAIHICYCHNTFRYAWTEREATLAARNALVRPVLGQILRSWRQWDYIAAQRVDAYVANSATTQIRVDRYFSRQSRVVYPPVELERFSVGVPEDYFLVLSELVSHKRIDLIVQACNTLRLPLVIAGDGPQARHLRQIAGPTVRLVGRVSDREAERLLRGSRALVVAATEEFGIAAVESQASGRPVIALRAGGLKETVIEGQTGIFFERPEADQLCAAFKRFEDQEFSSETCVQHAKNFSLERFASGLNAVISDELNKRTNQRPDHDQLGSNRPRRRGLALRVGS